MENEIEIWKDIAGYEGLYQVSNFGRVRSLKRVFIDTIGRTRHFNEIILNPKLKNGSNYLIVSLYKHIDHKHISKDYHIHRLVAKAFIPNPDNLPQINHKDENKLNNRIDNLEWCTQEYNLNYGTRLKRLAKSKSKPVLCVETGIIYPSINEASKMTNICRTSISKVLNKKTPAVYGYHWKFVD